MNRNILLTGLPRSGTTLVCHLLSSLPDVVALHEPMRVNEWAGLQFEQIVAKIEEFISENRRSLLVEDSAVSKHMNGLVPDNPISGEFADHGLRKLVVDRGSIHAGKKLPENFTLAIKHNAAFTALLHKLAATYTCFAIIRNPLAVLSSWQSVDLPVNRGHIPAAEALDPELKEALARIDDTLDRQLFILDWFYDRFDRNLPGNRIIRYEEVVATNGRSLDVIAPSATNIEKPLESRNQSRLYRKDLYEKLGERLLRSGGAHWKYYSRQDVEVLMTTQFEAE